MKNQLKVAVWRSFRTLPPLTEGGKVGQANPNKNGTYDLGPMQINTSWLPTLSKYGFTRN